MSRFLPVFGVFACVLAAMVPAPAHAQFWQCVTYARTQTAVDIRGNANTWWNQAEGRYARGKTPREGAVMAFRASRAMPLGHVAVVREVVSDREVILNHANWSRRGRVEMTARAIDVSEAGDWSAVRVWHSTSDAMGLRVNPVAGFIYPDAAPAPRIQMASLKTPRGSLLSDDVVHLASLELASGR